MSTISEFFDQKVQEILNHEVWKLFNSGTVNSEYYAWYLWQQRYRYERLEEYEKDLGVFEEFPELERYSIIRDDFEEIWKKQLNNRYMPNVAEMPATDFQKHLKEIFEDEEQDSDQILASLYAIVLSDLVIGTKLSVKLPGTGQAYNFNGDLQSLKNKIEAKLENASTPMLDEILNAFNNTFYLLDVVWNWSEVSKF